MKIVKKSFMLAIVLVVLFATTALAASTMYVKGDNVRIRSTPSVSSKSNILGTANKGDVCTVLAEVSGWTEVSVNGIEGYIRNDYLQAKKIESSRTDKSSKTNRNRTDSNPANETDTSTQNNVEMVWIPTNGGKKIHSKASCSGMENPAYVTIDEAHNRGFYDYCKKCH